MFFAIILSLTLAQSSLTHVVGVAGVRPDLVLVVVLGWAVWRGPTSGLRWAVIAGLCLDMLSSGPFGALTVPLVIVALLAGWLGHGRLFGGYLVLPLLLTFPLSLLYYLIYLALVSLMGRPVLWVPMVSQIALPASLLNLAATIILLPPLHSLHRRSTRGLI